MTTWYVDPVNGLDTYAGDSFAAGHPFKTLKKTFAAGDTILVAKSPETAAAGTVTATVGSVSVNTTSDLTGVIAQYTIIRIGGDNTLYMVKAITSSVITLYRPYRGTTAAGKGLTYFTSLPTSASNDWQPTAMTGTSGSHITIQGGVNTGTLSQDGFTILYGNNANYCLNGTWTFADLSRVATFYWSYPWAATLVDCTLTNCFSLRCSSSLGLTGSWTRVIVNGFVSELGKWIYNVTQYNCTYNQIETSETGQHGYYNNSNTSNIIINQWRNAGYSGYTCLFIDGTAFNVRFVDPIFDELAAGGTNIMVGLNGSYFDLVMQNPTFGAGTVFAFSSLAYRFTGKICLSNVNGSATDHRTYIGQPDNGKYALLSYDASTYHTAAPAAKVALFQSAYPTTIRHYIPCDAGVAKTISVYFRKNSSYGSATLPIMRLKWMTGSAGALVSNSQDVTMVDTNDTWLQYSYAVTPSVQGAIIMELIFQSANSGAIAWYDDIGVA